MYMNNNFECKNAYKCDSSKFAFTLAEVLITIGIIGVVAALTMPIFLHEMSERTNSNRQANIVQKITKAVELMAVNGDYSSFDDTDEFVDKLQKYLKITKRCDYEHLTDCWPVKTVETIDGKYNVANAKTGVELHTGNHTKNVGLVLTDGASIILTYNPDINPPSTENGFRSSRKELPVGNGKIKEFAYTSNATDAIDFVMDVNGGAGPNSEPDEDGKVFDIRSFKHASFSSATCTGTRFSDYCFVDIGTDYTPIDCTLEKNEKYCPSYKLYQVDYWAGVNKACDKLGMQQAPVSQLQALLNSKKIELPDKHFTYSLKFPETAYGINTVNGETKTYETRRDYSGLKGMCMYSN